MKGMHSKSPLVAALLIALSGSVAAQERVQGVECGVEREVSAGALTERTYNRLSDIYEQIGEENYAEAYPALQELLERNEREEYAQAVILQAMGHVRMQQEQPADAIRHFEESLRLNAMPNAQHFEMMLMVAHLYYGEERYQDALDQLDLWFCVVPDDQTNLVQVWVMKASIHAQIEEFREALAAVDRAIALSDDPKEQWYQLKLGMHLELGEYRPAIDVLKILVQMSPEKKNYWLQMASLHAELGEETESKSVLHLAYRQGLLERQAEFKQLASLLQAQDSPRLAAEVMEDGLERGIIEDNRRHWEMVGGAWYEAREQEKALVAYERAGAQSEDGKIDLQRGHLLVNLERWEEARDAMDRALELGGLSESQTGNAWLLLGMSYSNLGNYDAAMDAFENASQYRRVSSAAREWMNHIRQERNRSSRR
ncbi:MAG: tetratricopeptide repeat protein [Wenzhouxiangella sp.]|jgi:tetratricopeptide (TPR) repeat protein|nr:tetratricopeptide repeat protein [Wenzhouxiangella sp.]